MSNSQQPRVVGFAGSAREASLNKKLVTAALAACAELGVETTQLDLREYPLPLYDGDLEAAEGLPENAARLREVLKANDGFIVAAPEYNGSITPLLKNTLDWVSRSPEASPDLSPYQGKFAVIAAASPGPLGGLRGLKVVRDLLTNLGVNVLANQVTLRSAHQEFSDDGSLAKAANQQKLAGLAAELAGILHARVSGP